jgi:predicted CoA-substrate-specific enzyme activase
LAEEMKVTAGIDIGSTTSKAIILKGDSIAACYIGQSTVTPKKTAEIVFTEALSRAGLDREQVSYVVGTGYGRAKVDFADLSVSEITCHARGAHFLLPEVRTIIDIGGQDTKVIRIDKGGMLEEFAMNDKCAAGTGRFLEFMARSLGMTIDEMVRIYFEEGSPVVISSICSVFAESEVISMINDEVPIPSIVKGIHKSVAVKVMTLVRRVGMEKDIILTGGVAKNKGVADALERELGFALVHFPDNIDPQAVGALGAAVIGLNKSRQ